VAGKKKRSVKVEKKSGDPGVQKKRAHKKEKREGLAKKKAHGWCSGKGVPDFVATTARSMRKHTPHVFFPLKTNDHCRSKTSRGSGKRRSTRSRKETKNASTAMCWEKERFQN